MQVWLAEIDRQVLSTRSPVDHGHRRACCDTSMVVSGGVDCGRRRHYVYDKKPQRYAKDNKRAHLTARIPVAYVTNNKRLYSTFCSVESNYWQTRSIARPICDSRATCWLLNYLSYYFFVLLLLRQGGIIVCLSFCLSINVTWLPSVIPLILLHL